MLGLDTNLLVRYFVQDDAAQARKASALIESLTPERRGYVTHVVLVEVVWVLSRAYGAEKSDIVRILETLVRSKEILVESTETAWKAVRRYADSAADFADCLIERSCYDAQCEYTVTFDGKAAKALGMQLLR